MKNFVDTPEAVQKLENVSIDSLHQMADCLHLYASTHLTHVKNVQEQNRRVNTRLDQIVCGVFFAVALLVFHIART